MDAVGLRWTEPLVYYMNRSSLGNLHPMLQLYLWNGGPAGIANGTSKEHGNAGGQPTLRKRRCTNFPSGNALTIGSAFGPASLEFDFEVATVNFLKR